MRGAMNPHRFVILDQLSANELGHFPTRAAAEECWLRFIDAEPTAVEHLEIWDYDKGIRLDVDLDAVRATTAA